jgi:hypothetical protein
MSIKSNVQTKSSNLKIPRGHNSSKITPIPKIYTAFELTETKSDYFINSPYYWYYKEARELNNKKIKPIFHETKLKDVLSKSLQVINPINNEIIEDQKKIAMNVERKSKFYKFKIIYKALKREPRQVTPKTEKNLSSNESSKNITLSKPRKLTIEQINELSISEKFINDAKKMLFCPETNSFILPD